MSGSNIQACTVMKIIFHIDLVISKNELVFNLIPRESSLFFFSPFFPIYIRERTKTVDDVGLLCYNRESTTTQASNHTQVNKQLLPTASSFYN